MSQARYITSLQRPKQNIMKPSIVLLDFPCITVECANIKGLSHNVPQMVQKREYVCNIAYVKIKSSFDISQIY